MTLLFETSPYGNIDAIVQHDQRAVYLYLNGRAEPGKENRFGTRACWVRNLVAGPLVLNEQEMRDGIAPLLPRTETVNREPLPLPNADDLLIVWLEEGNGAALLERRVGRGAGQLPAVSDAATDSLSDYETIAVIPPWSGVDGFHGYAKETATENPLCWPLPTNPRLQQRIESAHEFWRGFRQADDPFVQLRNDLIAAYAHHLGEAIDVENAKHFLISGDRFPPRGMVEYPTDRHTILMTVGLSLCPQPSVEMTVEHPAQFRRIELGIVVPKQTQGEAVDVLRGQLSGLANYPWQFFTWLGAGHTCAFPGIAAQCDTVKLSAAVPLETQVQPWGFSFRGDPVNLLWLVPVAAE